MYNWNIGIIKLKKNKKKYTIWRLEQMVNYGLDGGKISKTLLKKYWNQLNLDLNVESSWSLYYGSKKYIFDLDEKRLVYQRSN